MSTNSREVIFNIKIDDENPADVVIEVQHLEETITPEMFCRMAAAIVRMAGMSMGLDGALEAFNKYVMEGNYGGKHYIEKNDE